MANTLGTRIAENRKRKNITQDCLAEQMGVSTQAVSKWENDLSCPDITLLPRLADYFNTTIDELMRGESAKTVQLVPENERKDFNKLLLKLDIVSEDGDIVKINLPLALLKVALETGLPFLQIGGGGGVSLKDIDFNAVLMAAEQGAMGKFLEIHSGGDHIEIYIE